MASALVTNLPAGVDRSACPGTITVGRRRRARNPARRAPARYADATGARRRLQALAAIGWSFVALAEQTGPNRNTLTYIASGWWHQISPATARQITELYDRLSTTPGPRPLVARQARTRGWALPCRWVGVDIDDPQAVPEPFPQRELLPPRYVDATGARRRLRALAAIGWSCAALAEQTGLHRNTLNNIRSGCWQQIGPATAQVVAEVYDQLSMTPGRAPVAAWARNLGWGPPLAWDDADIDNPAAAPAPEPGPPPPRRDVDEVAVQRAVDGWPVTLNEAEQRAAIGRLWPDLELTVEQIAGRVGSNPARIYALARGRGWRRRNGSGGWLR